MSVQPELKIESPVTGRHTAELLMTLDTNTIISCYKNELGIDVASYFSNLTNIYIYECKESKYRFYYPLNILGDSAFYEELQNVQGGDYYPTSKWEYDRALEFVKSGDRLLEIGSGVGHFLEQAITKKAKVTGLELNTSAVEISKGKGLDVYNEMLNAHVSRVGMKYDVVCSFQVLEHIPDVRNYINDCLSALKMNGYLIFAVPNNNPYLFGHDVYHTLNLPPHHAGLWNGESMKQLEKEFPVTLEMLGFEPLKEYKKWYQVQVAHYKEKKPLLATVLNLVPRQLYKPAVKLLRHKIQGAYLTAVFKKN